MHNFVLVVGENPHTAVEPFEEEMWDWYAIGGRWSGRIQVKTGVEHKTPAILSGLSDEEKKKFLANNPNATDTARKKDIANLHNLIPYAIVVGDEWINKGYLESDEMWISRVKETLGSIDDDERLTIVDCHN